MDGRITALRVGFLSSSHQLAGLNFSVASAPYRACIHLLVFFAIVLTAVVGVVFGRFDSGVGAPSPYSVVLRDFRRESWRWKSCTTSAGAFGPKCFFFAFCVAVFFWVLLTSKIWATIGQD